MPAPLQRDGRSASTNRKEVRMPTKTNTPEAIDDLLDRFDDIWDFHYPSLRAADTYGANPEGFTARELAITVKVLIDTLPPSGLL